MTRKEAYKRIENNKEWWNLRQESQQAVDIAQKALLEADKLENAFEELADRLLLGNFEVAVDWGLTITEYESLEGEIVNAILTFIRDDLGVKV